MAPFMDNNVAAGAILKAPSRVHVALAIIESFWGCVAQLSASCCVDRVSPEAKPAGSPGGNRQLYE